MFVLARAITYASIFVGLLLVFVPARLITWSGIVRPESIGPWQVAGMVVGGVLGPGCTFFCWVGSIKPQAGFLICQDPIPLSKCGKTIQFWENPESGENPTRVHNPRRVPCPE